MYKKITHNIVEEHFQHPSVLPMLHKVSKSNENEEDVLKLNVPLMIRLLEWAREDAFTDVELHRITERLIDLSEEGATLTMSDYPEIVRQDEKTEKENKS